MLDKFCFKCGTQLTDNFYCISCEMHGNCYSVNQQDKIEQSEQLKDARWLKYNINHYPETAYERYFCHTCMYIQFHSLIWCPKCGGQFAREKISSKQILEKYAHYKQGF